LCSLLVETEPFENVEVNSVAKLFVPIDTDVSYATEAEVAQQAPGPMAETSMEPHGAEARDPDVAGTWCWVLPQGDVAGAGEHYEHVIGVSRVTECFEFREEPRLSL